MRLSVNGVEFSYGSRKTLNGITMEISEGDVTAILGPNGVGKTTLLKCLNDILHPGAGSVMIGETEIGALSRREIAKEIGYVAQRGEPSSMTVYESVLLGRRPHITLDATEKDHAITGRVIDLMGLGSISDRHVNEISGGQYQLVQIARAFVQQPKIILLDEPTNNLDPANQHMIMHFIRNIIKANNMAAVMVVHDLNMAIWHADKFVLMKGGDIYAAGGVEVITPENISEVYGLETFVENIHGMTVVVPKKMDEVTDRARSQ